MIHAFRGCGSADPAPLRCRFAFRLNDPEAIGSKGNDLEQRARLPNHRLRLISPPAFAGSSRSLRFQISLRAPVLRCRYGLTVSSRASAAPTVCPSPGWFGRASGERPCPQSVSSLAQILDRTSPPCLDDDDGLRLPAVPKARPGGPEKKESSVRRLTPPCRQCAKPSLTACLAHRRSIALTADVASSDTPANFCQSSARRRGQISMERW